jgi:hypothetical protein
MNVYRWYSEALHIGGITCAKYADIAKEQALDYLKDMFPWDDEELHEKGYEDIELQVWPITEDCDYDTKHPMTVATHY